MSHIEIIESIVKTYDLPVYIEIGVGDGGCFNRVARFASEAYAVDNKDRSHYIEYNFKAQASWLGSDAFFQSFYELGYKADVIFIDGDHDEDQVTKDWWNAIRVLSRDGMVLLHDGWPGTREQIPLGCDTAYRAIERIERLAHFECFTLPIFPGLTLARPHRERFT